MSKDAVKSVVQAAKINTLFKHQRQRAQATYTPAKSSTIMHVIQRYKIKQYDKRKMAVIEWEGKITMHIKQLRHTKFVTR